MTLIPALMDRLTPAIESEILRYIRAGGYPHVAAEAAGVPAAVFAAWLARGRRPGARGRYRTFYRNVLQAAAQARLKAELDVQDKKPDVWLRHGPGRDRPEAPGWSSPARSVAGAGDALLVSAEWGRLARALLAALEPFPEARAAAANVLAADGPSRRDGRGRRRRDVS